MSMIETYVIPPKYQNNNSGANVTVSPVKADAKKD